MTREQYLATVLVEKQRNIVQILRDGGGLTVGQDKFVSVPTALAIIDRLITHGVECEGIIVDLVRLGLTDLAQENVAMYGRRLMRRRPELAERLRPLVPVGNILRANAAESRRAAVRELANTRTHDCASCDLDDHERGMIAGRREVYAELRRILNDTPTTTGGTET